jgi:hypothetical protein
LGFSLSESTPDHSSLSRIRQRLPREAYQAVEKVDPVGNLEGLLK